MDIFDVLLYALIGIIVAAAIVGCVLSQPILDEGIVVDKEYMPPRLLYCGGSRWVPTIAKFLLIVEGNTTDGEQRIEAWRVSPEEFYTTEIGDVVHR